MPSSLHEALVQMFRHRPELAAELQGRAQGRVEGRAEGKVEGEAAALFAVLSARGIEVPDDARARITACTDLDQLETWIRRAATAESVADLFE